MQERRNAISYKEEEISCHLSKNECHAIHDIIQGIHVISFKEFMSSHSRKKKCHAIQGRRSIMSLKEEGM